MPLTGSLLLAPSALVGLRGVGRGYEVAARRRSRPELLSEASSGSWSAVLEILVREHIERVVVDRREAQIIRKVTGLTSRSGEADGHGDTPKVYRAQLPAPQPRARKEIIIPGEPTPRRVNHGLILAIARAKTWMQGLCDGRYKDARGHANRAGGERQRMTVNGLSLSSIMQIP